MRHIKTIIGILAYLSVFAVGIFLFCSYLDPRSPFVHLNKYDSAPMTQQELDFWAGKTLDRSHPLAEEELKAAPKGK